MPSLLHDILRTGVIAGLVSGVAATAFSRARNDRGAPAINAVSHIAWGGAPPADDGPGGRNFLVGAGLHVGASLFWAVFFEAFFGRAARRDLPSAWLGAAATAASAYCTDYHIVPRRLRPGMEAFLSRRGLYGVYAALAVGFALAARSDAAAGRRGRAAGRNDAGSIASLPRSLPARPVSQRSSTGYPRLA